MFSQVYKKVIQPQLLMQPPLISHSICRKMQKKRCEGQNPTSAETEAKTTWFLVITKLMKRNKKHTGEAYPHLLETRYFFPAWKYEEMSLLLLSSPGLKAGMAWASKITGQTAPFCKGDVYVLEMPQGNKTFIFHPFIKLKDLDLPWIGCPTNQYCLHH